MFFVTSYFLDASSINELRLLFEDESSPPLNKLLIQVDIFYINLTFSLY